MKSDYAYCYGCKTDGGIPKICIICNRYTGNYDGAYYPDRVTMFQGEVVNGDCETFTEIRSRQ